MPSVNRNYCKNHPTIETTWMCVECGSEFCDNCVKPVEHYYVRTAICPKCKGRCEDFKAEAENLRQSQEEAKKNKRKAIIRYAVFSLLAIPFVFDVIRWLPPFFTTELKFLLLLIAALWFGPLRNIDIIYKLGSLLYFGWLAHPILVAALLLGGSSSKMGHLLFYTPVKYLAESILIGVGFFVVEEISGFISRIYYSKDQISVSKFGVKGWVLSTFSLTVVISLIVFGVIKLIPEQKEDDVTQIKKLTYKIAEEMAKEDIDRSKVMKLEEAFNEKLNKLNPQTKGNETEEMLNSLLEPYRTLTLNEAWQHYEKGREKLGDDMVWVKHLKTNIFDRDFRNYKTVAEVIEKGTPFSKYYLYVHLKYVPLDGSR